MSIETFEYPPRHPSDHGRGKSKQSRRERRMRQDMFNEQKGLCFWCGEKMQMNALRYKLSGEPRDNPRYASFEHYVPRSKGGRRTRGNIVLAHAVCNNKRHKRKWPHDPVYGDKENWI